MAAAARRPAVAARHGPAPPSDPGPALLRREVRRRALRTCDIRPAAAGRMRPANAVRGVAGAGRKAERHTSISRDAGRPALGPQ